MCLVLILNHSVLKRPEGFLMNLNTTKCWSVFLLFLLLIKKFIVSSLGISLGFCFMLLFVGGLGLFMPLFDTSDRQERG